MAGILPKKILSHSTSLGFILYLIGVIAFFSLSQEDVNYSTYVSENALLVGVVDETFRDENTLIPLYTAFSGASSDKMTLFGLLRNEMEKLGLEFYEQSFTYASQLSKSLENVTGTNIYAIMRSRSGSRTESIVVTAPLRYSTELTETLAGSYSFLISVACKMRKQLYWAKDVIFLFPDLEFVGLIAWLDAYHGVSTNKFVVGSELIGRAGSLQAGLNIEFPSLRLSSVDISYQGINGELPNLDLINTITRISQKLKVPLSLHGQLQWYSVSDRLIPLSQLLSSMWIQASGSPSGLHGPLINFQIPTITLRGIPSSGTVPPTTESLEAIGCLIEAFLRCLNNLQESFHQSFYYYLLPNINRYISIGVFTPPFFIALSGWFLQVLVVYSEILEILKSKTYELTDKVRKLAIQKRSEIPLGTTVHEKDVVGSRPDLERKETSETPPSVYAVVNYQLGPAAFSALASLGLCFLVCIALNVLPEAVFALALRTQDLESIWQAVEFYFLSSFVLLFALIALLLPTIAHLGRSRWFGFGQDRGLTMGLASLLWCIFLGFLSHLNISASFFLLLLIEPVMLCLHCRPKRLNTVVEVSALLLVSPPALLILAHLINPYVVQYPPVTPVTGNRYQQLGGTLLQTYLEASLVGSWTWNLATTVLVPLWMFTLNGLMLSSDSKKKEGLKRNLQTLLK